MKFEKLKNIIEVKKGKKPSFVDFPDENSIRVLQIDDLRNDNNPKFTNDKTGVFAKADDVLIAWDGANAGTIGYGKSGYIGSTIALLRKKQPDLYSTTFIGIFLQSKYQYLRSKTTGATIPHISRKALDDLEVPVISVNDQLHIANLLSKAENLIAQRKESIRLLDEYLKSTFLEMFGSNLYTEKRWNIEPFGNYIETLTDYHANGSYESLREIVNLKKENDYALMVRTTDLQNNNFEKDCNYIDERAYNFLGKSKVFGGEIIINKIGSAGKVYLMPFLNRPVSLGMNAFLLRFDRRMNNSYTYFLLTSSFGESEIQKNVKGAVTKTITKDAIRKIKIPIPPIELQTQFSQIVEKTEDLKTQYQQSLQELEQLYGSLSQKAFRGELIVKEVSV